jgi:glycosyltransferase involved in cell wall biosynthesis
LSTPRVALHHPEPAWDRPLRIALVAPPWFHVPPSGYGGIESLVADLADGLVARGHEVTLVAAGRRGTSAQRFVPTYAEPPSHRLGDPMPEAIQAARAAAVLADLDVDLVHDHTLAGPLLARHRRVPTVLTAHGPVAGEPGDYLAALGATVEVVAISQAQQRARPEINWISTVHNAIDVASFPVGRGDGRYVLFIGRFNPDKGVHLAIDAARAAGRRIVVAGKLNEAAERAYFDAEIRPRLGPGVDYVGEADAVTKRELYAGAEALLFPACWEEPFGLVMIEAMACGTPVVALRRGSVPEVVDHGRSGIVVDTPAQLAGAIDEAAALDRARCRAHAELHFDIPVMVAGYEAAYRTVVEGRELARSAHLHADSDGDHDLVAVS